MTRAEQEQGFNPRAREGRDSRHPLHLTEAGRFNPRAREGRDAIDITKRGNWIEVSIHAPARGATGQYFPCGIIQCVSIHAPARGATYLWTSLDRAQALFQSTRPRGARLPA